MSKSAAPPWSEEDLFGDKPEAPAFGLRDPKGKKDVSFDSLEDLAGFLAKGKGGLGWVWTPESPYLVAPEEIPELREALETRERLLAGYQLSDAKRNGLIFGALLVWSLAAAASRPGGIGASQSVGLSGLLFLIFALVPWFASRKNLRASTKKTDWEAESAEARFDLWMIREKVRFIWVVLALVTVVGLAQILGDGGIQQSISEAGILKDQVRKGQWWLVFTGAFLHGNALHFLMNASALWYFGKRVEVLARWPHLVIVMLFSIATAGWATVTFLPDIPSVGISGGIAGLLGFLLVFETLHPLLIPRSARYRLLGTLGLMALIGFIAQNFIDNAAHLGGLLGGAIYGLVVFPKTSSPRQPAALLRDRILGGLSLALLTAFAALAIFLMIRA